MNVERGPRLTGASGEILAERDRRRRDLEDDRLDDEEERQPPRGRRRVA